MPGGQRGAEWITVKAKNKGRNRDAKVDSVVEPLILHKSEKGKRNGPGRQDKAVLDNVTESSAYTEISSRTSRSASPSSANASRGSADDHLQVPEPRKKKNKTRRHKTSPGQIVLSADALDEAIAAAVDRYEDDSSSQLGSVTDFFVAQYRASEFPFNRTVLEQTLEKVMYGIVSKILCLPQALRFISGPLSPSSEGQACLSRKFATELVFCSKQDVELMRDVPRRLLSYRFLSSKPKLCKGPWLSIAVLNYKHCPNLL
jgi:hypothetical protein